MVSYYLYSPWTRDARIRADVITVVSGYVTGVRVREDQFVRKADILFVIEQDRYRLALADAEAKASARFAQHQMLLHQLERRLKLTVGLAVTQEELDNARHQSDSAAANLAKGDYASPSKPVLPLIDSDSYRVDAYFEEIKIPQIKAGSPVDIRLLNGAATLQWKVESIARGITDYDNRDGSELLANVNPTFTWVRLAQRIPVRIRLTDVPADTLISAGMTCTVVLKEGAEPHIGAGLKRLMATIWPASSAMASASAPAPSRSSDIIYFKSGTAKER